MRIFYASDTTPNAAFESKLWRNNLYLPLVDLGHDVIEFEYDLRETFQNLNPVKCKDFIEKNRPKVSAALLRQVQIAHKIKPLDLFFSYFTDACVLPETIGEIRAMGIKTANWYCNGSYQLHLVEEISPHYDWCLVPERFRLNDYVRMGARPIYCQEAANPNIYKPYEVAVEYDVSFVGQAYGDRPAYIKYLIDQGLDVRVWGYGWRGLSSELVGAKAPNALTLGIQIAQKLLTPRNWLSVASHLKSSVQKRIPRRFASSLAFNERIQLPSNRVGGILSDIDMVKMYSRSKINLGFSTCGTTHLTNERIVQVRLRDFEVPMSGGFYMVEYMEELEEFYEIGKEIVCYTSPEDLADKIKYYLRHDTEREAIRQAGHLRAVAEHSWHKRFENVFHKIGFIE